MDQRFKPLFEPLPVGSVTIRNRILSTAHTSGAGRDGVPGQRYLRYQEEKAIGGIGLTIIGGSTAVAHDTPGAGMLHLDATRDAIIPHYRRLAERLHEHGTVVFSQLAHMGRRAGWDYEHWLPPIAPSRVREPAHRAFPKEMEPADFRRIVAAFAAAATRVREGGLDGIELSATHGHLFDQFWSPRSNRREDEYGGSLDNRLRFTFEVIAAVRAAVGCDYVLGLRLSGDELLQGGLDGPECTEIARRLVGEGSLDYLSVLGSNAENLPAHATIFPGMAARIAPYIGFAAAIKRAVNVPVFYAQRINDLPSAARAVGDGVVDMVGMTRAHMADPHLVRKLREGRIQDIRPCVGANYCIDRLYAGKQALCLHNAATGREQTMHHRITAARRSRRIVVAGGGPAGLEAARVAAARGHDVTLLERSEELGGQVLDAVRAPGRAGLIDVVRWLERQVRAAGVDVRLGVCADAATIAGLAPEVVVVATGGRPARPDFPGGEHVETVVDALHRSAGPRERVLVFDDNGAEPALSCAQHLASAGANVTFVTADPAPGALLERTTRPVFLRSLYESAATFLPDRRVVAVSPAGGGGLHVTLVNEYDDQRHVLAVDRVIADHGTTPDERLYRALLPDSINDGELDIPAFAAGRRQRPPRRREAGYLLYRIGDAVASRNIHASIYDALRLCAPL